MSKSKTIMMIAGEASGDSHGAEVIKAIHQKSKDIKFVGIGGSAMRKAGMEMLFDAAKIAVVGIVEVLKHYGEIKQAWRLAVDTLKTRKPDLLILIDYPGFNLRLAKVAHELGIKILYYVSPQIWAWHKSRIHKIKAYVNHMAVILPFEEKFYKDAGVPATYVGCPMVDEVKSVGGKAKARAKLKLPKDKTIIGLAPGSRHSELSRLLPVLAIAADRLHAHYPNSEFVIPLASTITREDIESYFIHSPIKPVIIEEHSDTVIEACDVLVCSSGTITLETAIIGTPMVIIYKTAPLTYMIGKRLVTIDHIGLCNIIAGKRLVAELLQHDLTADNIVLETQKLLDDNNARETMLKGYTEIRKKLGHGGAAKNVAKLAFELI